MRILDAYPAGQELVLLVCAKPELHPDEGPCDWDLGPEAFPRKLKGITGSNRRPHLSPVVSEGGAPITHSNRAKAYAYQTASEREADAVEEMRKRCEQLILDREGVPAQEVRGSRIKRLIGKEL
jgi:hypothetical protein